MQGLRKDGNIECGNIEKAGTENPILKVTMGTSKKAVTLYNLYLNFHLKNDPYQMFHLMLHFLMSLFLMLLT